MGDKKGGYLLSIISSSLIWNCSVCCCSLSFCAFSELSDLFDSDDFLAAAFLACCSFSFVSFSFCSCAFFCCACCDSTIAFVIVVAHQSSGSTRQRNGYSCLNKDVEPHVYETRNRKKRYSFLNGGRYLWETMPVTISFRNYLPGNVMSSSKQEEIAMDCASVSYI